MQSSPSRLALLGLGLGVLLALLLAPQTRWLVRLQVLTSLNLYHPLPAIMPETGGPYTTSPASDARRLRQAAQQHPNDYPTQYAYAMTKPEATEVLAALRALTARFPNSPALYAALLRHETRGNVMLHRVEDYLGEAVPEGYKPPPPPAPAALAAFDQEAAAGERLDPDNAYFPLMRAIGLFSAHRDAEGLDAVHQASLKPYWREYLPDEVHSQWGLHEEAFGDPGALGRIALFSQTLFPQYAPLRGVARVATYKAMLAERAGRWEEGLAIRRDLMHCGGLMRVQSTSYIGSLVGVALTSVARSQPGGRIGSFKNDPALTPEQNIQKRLDLYCAYVRRLGHEDAAQEAQADAAAGAQVRALGRSGVFEQITRQGTRLTGWWLADLATLANVLWLLGLFALASLLARSRWAREAGNAGVWDWKAFLKRTAGALGVGLVLALLALLFWNAADLSARMPDWQVYLGGLLGLAALVFGLRWVFSLNLAWKPKRPALAWGDAAAGLRTALFAALWLSGIVLLARWQAGGMQSLWLGQAFLFFDMSGDSAGSVGENPAAAFGLRRDEQALQVSAAAALALPLLLALALTIAARVQGVLVLVGLVRGFRAWALPLACGMVLVCGGLMLATLRQEAVVRAGLERTVVGEGPYLAELTGQPWPGPTR